MVTFKALASIARKCGRLQRNLLWDLLDRISKFIVRFAIVMTPSVGVVLGLKI